MSRPVMTESAARCMICPLTRTGKGRGKSCTANRCPLWDPMWLTVAINGPIRFGRGFDFYETKGRCTL
jgi:hypothetical protein